MARKISILFFCLLFGMYSCKKDTPPGYPGVQITSPYSLAVFSVPCTIQVTGHVSDSKLLTSVTVYIANSGNIPVEQTIQIPITSNNMDVSCSYTLNDIHMPGGTYYMAITASNGTNVASAFQQIYINALPRKRTAIYAIARNSSGVHAWGVDSVFKVSPAYNYTVPGDYSSSDINSYYQQLYIAGHDSGNVNVSSVPTVTSDWSIAGSVSTSPCFTNVYCNNDAEFISYYLGYVKCYSHFGVMQSVYTVNQGYYPIKAFLWSGWLFSEEKSISLSGGENLLVFYQASSAGLQQTTLPGSVVAMYGYDDNDIFVFGNNTSGTGYMNLYNIQTNLFYSPTSLPSAHLLSVAQINANAYLLSFSNGIIYQYTYNPNGITPYINGITASTIRYDSINNQIITASGNIVNEYNYSIGSATLVGSVTISDSVQDVRVLYNK